MGLGCDRCRLVFEAGEPVDWAYLLVNLLANARDAIQATAPPEGLIRLEIAAVDGRATLRCSDNGAGIRAEPLARIFEPYFTDKAAGTGLGLYMSRMIMEQSMAGAIEARNIPDGAEFLLSLPLAEAGPGQI